MKRRSITKEQIALFFSGITAIFILIMPSLLKTIPDFVSGNYTAELVRENINMTVAYILLALIPFVIAGWAWAFKRAGEKPDVDAVIKGLEERLKDRFDAIDKKLEVLKREDKSGGQNTDKPE